jgi:hypothetical protein
MTAMSCLCDMHERAGMHCRACCRTFSGITAFDRHWQRGHHDPADIGLVQQSSGRWGFPIDDAARERLQALQKKRSASVA